MTRLNKRIKEHIVNNAFVKAGIPDKKAALRDRLKAWGESVRILVIGGEGVDAKIKQAETAIRSALKGVPAELLTSGGFFNRNYAIHLNVAGYSYKAYFNGKGDVLKVSPNHYVIPGDVLKVAPDHYVIPQGDPLAEEFHAIETVRLEIIEQEQTVRASVAGVTSGAGSVKKLLEMWPEAKELLPEDLSPVKKQLPAVRPEELNAMLGLPSVNEGADNT